MYGIPFRIRWLLVILVTIFSEKYTMATLAFLDKNDDTDHSCQNLSRIQNKNTICLKILHTTYIHDNEYRLEYVLSTEKTLRKQLNCTNCTNHLNPLDCLELSN